MDVSASSAMSHILCSSQMQGITSCRKLNLLIFTLFISFTAVQIECKQQANSLQMFFLLQTRCVYILMVRKLYHVLIGNALQGPRRHSRNRGGVPSLGQLADETASAPPGIAICALVENPQEVCYAGFLLSFACRSKYST